MNTSNLKEEVNDSFEFEKVEIKQEDDIDLRN